jgi:hypothetical protein
LESIVELFSNRRCFVEAPCSKWPACLTLWLNLFGDLICNAATPSISDVAK